MKSMLKWVLVVGAILFVLLVVGMLIFNFSWMGQSSLPYGHGMMMYGGRHSTFGGWISSGGLIFGGLFFLVVVGALFLVIRSKPENELASADRSNPLEVCPACAENLEPSWKHCPFCGYDLS
jgi:hypothetical protein